MPSLRFLALAVCLCAIGAQATGQATGTATAAAGAGGAMEQLIQSVTKNVMGQWGTLTQGAGDVKSQISSLSSTFSKQFAGLGDQAEAAAEAYAAQHCKDAKFTPSKKMPAKFTGHGFAVEFSSGSCEYNHTASKSGEPKILNCTEPSIGYTKVGANFTSKYHSAPKFTSKECKLTQSFGEDSLKVLYVFDSTTPLDVDDLTAKITSEVKSAMTALPGDGKLMGGWGAAAPSAVPTAGAYATADTGASSFMSGFRN